MSGKKNFTSDDLFDILSDPKIASRLGNYDVYVYPTVYGSTCLGYPGIGGAAMTEGTCVVVWMKDNGEAAVYPGRSDLGYIIKNPTQEFWNDLSNHALMCAHEQLLTQYGEVTYVYGKEKK